MGTPLTETAMTSQGEKQVLEMLESSGVLAPELQLAFLCHRLGARLSIGESEMQCDARDQQVFKLQGLEKNELTGVPDEANCSVSAEFSN